ncbi:DinB family protein [Chelativorans intermedius]|uniref:DinB family protein n=1 Tax=Chelativorans intermedius TaxID=515947 RepID=A0ABV6D4T2_9HYPH|nr:DinB family protein [Chelativorans intermedius]MCT8998989.1 DinB family protein [Chelativorans intermedius]
MKKHFEMMAAYNHWANSLLYAAAAELSEEEYGRDVGAFFKSMKGTLNHILVADRIWMKRFTGKGNAPARLDAVLYEAFPALRQAREAEDQRIIEWVASLDRTTLEGRFTYMTVVNPRMVSQRLAPALTHFFNHQTHHRGQAHMILSVLGKEPPSLDIIYFHRTPEGQAYS